MFKKKVRFDYINITPSIKNNYKKLETQSSKKYLPLI